MLPAAKTLADVLEVAEGSRTALVCPERGIRVNYHSLRRQVATLADTLAGAGIRRGDRVATALPNGLPAAVSFLAAARAATAAPLNPGYRYDEFRFFLEDTEARLLLCPPEGAKEARRAAAELSIPVLPIEMNDHGVCHLPQESKRSHAEPPAPHDVALVLHTSGSTGRPKRVPLQHASLAYSARSIAQTYSLTAEDVALCLMPLFHVHGLMASLMATLVSGGAVVIPAKFDTHAFWRYVKDSRVSWYSGVPTMHQLLLARATGKRRPAEAASLRFIRSCSTPLSVDVIHKMEEVFGVPLVEAYGMTEAAHQMASNPLPPAERRPGSVGMPQGVRVSILGAEGKFLKKSHRGEIVIQGPSVFHGYEGNTEGNDEAFAAGWFRTGDEGYLDSHGYLHITGRLKEQINRAGEKISPREIDRVLLACPLVAEAVTYGFPHATLGEEVAAAVVLKEPVSNLGQRAESVLLKYCQERLATFKCPKKIHVVESIPQTATGKIRRNTVAAALLDGKVNP